MMSILKQLSGLALIGLLATACSSTTTKDSWVKPDYTNKIENVYLVGIAKEEIMRMLFEDTFNRELSGQGVQAVSSYNDLPKDQKDNRDNIIQAMKANGCDSVLMTRLVRTRKEVVSTRPEQQMVKVTPVPVFGDPWYNNWNSYYYRSTGVINIPAKVNEEKILTVESVLYDLKTEEMIWATQVESVDKVDIKKMIEDYVKEVTRTLKSEGLI